MMTVKVECDCGQHYAFDVEPSNGRMPSGVACPSCGLDGTAAANAVIASQLSPTAPIIAPFAPPPIVPIRSATPPPPPALVAAPAVPVKLSRHNAEPTPAPEQPVEEVISQRDRELGIVGKEQAQAEARAKISWGDSREDVIKYLMLQRYSVAEAKELVDVMFKERMATIRVIGIRKIITGIGLMCVPVITLGIFHAIGFYFLKLLAVAVMVGLYGLWQLANGIIALVAPKMESGDVADQ